MEERGKTHSKKSSIRERTLYISSMTARSVSYVHYSQICRSGKRISPCPCSMSRNSKNGEIKVRESCHSVRAQKDEDKDEVEEKDKKEKERRGRFE